MPISLSFGVPYSTGPNLHPPAVHLALDPGKSNLVPKVPSLYAVIDH